MFKYKFKIKQSNKTSELKKPDAAAYIKGGANYKNITGTVSFFQRPNGVIVTSEIFNLPVGANCNSAFLGYHIHEGQRCAGNEQDEYLQTGGHYNPHNYPHPYHVGDLLPIMSNGGYAWSSFLTNRFKVEEIIGRTIIIHLNPDDFTTQPSGNSGQKIACGEIIKL